MALKAFHDNPCIGGFGGESAVAFTSNKDDLPVENPLCQIVKELVDNAVDACTSSSVPTQLGRVKVEIYPYEQDDSILRVKISDTGEGMKNIQVCVDAFQSTKVSSSHDTASRQQLQTAGRYGIGLTLCMLHAQRLVSNSYSCITSATKDQPTYTRAFYVVDSNKDSVVCIKTEALEKPSQGESGTCVSLLVPGGITAKLAWTRLANYFARFRMRSNQETGPEIEVLAPTLSKQPIFVRTQQAFHNNDTNGDEDEENKQHWQDGLDDDSNCMIAKKEKPLTPAQKRKEVQRKAVFRAAQSFLMGSNPIKLENVAHSIQTIRMKNSNASKDELPKLQVDLVVNPSCSSDENKDEPVVANMKLIRMVNNIPLLDGAEACACGLVHGISNKLVWGTFGLQVAIAQTSGNSSDCCWTPQHNIRDSDQVAPFIHQSNQHGLWAGNKSKGTGREDNLEPIRKRKSISKVTSFPPAKVRLGEITIIINIQAVPSSLPLPTLSKGRLPLNHQPIDTALQLGLRDCLRSLQRTNPALLLTPSQLRSAVREIRYIPAMALAVSRILTTHANSTTEIQQGQEDCLDVIRKWRKEYDTDAVSPRQNFLTNDLSEATICELTEERLKLSIIVKQKAIEEAKRRKKKRTKKQNDNSGDEYSDLDGSDVDMDKAMKLFVKDRNENFNKMTSRFSFESNNDDANESLVSSVWNGHDQSIDPETSSKVDSNMKGKEVVITIDTTEEVDEFW